MKKALLSGTEEIPTTRLAKASLGARMLWNCNTVHTELMRSAAPRSAVPKPARRGTLPGPGAVAHTATPAARGSLSASFSLRAQCFCRGRLNNELNQAVEDLQISLAIGNQEELMGSVADWQKAVADDAEALRAMMSAMHLELQAQTQMLEAADKKTDLVLEALQLLSVQASAAPAEAGGGGSHSELMLARLLALRGASDADEGSAPLRVEVALDQPPPPGEPEAAAAPPPVKTRRAQLKKKTAPVEVKVLRAGVPLTLRVTASEDSHCYIFSQSSDGVVQPPPPSRPGLPVAPAVPHPGAAPRLLAPSRRRRQAMWTASCQGRTRTRWCRTSCPRAWRVSSRTPRRPRTGSASSWNPHPLRRRTSASSPSR